MSRRGGTVYEEERRDTYYREGPPPPPPPPVQVRTREREREPVYEEEIYTRREREGSRPEFLREDYGRAEGGPLVLRERQTETITRPRPRSPSPPPVRIRERIIQREDSPPVRVRERVIEREDSPPPVERVRTRVVERETRQRSPSPPPERLRARVVETRERIRERSPSPVRYRERVIEREREVSPPPAVERVRIRNFERQPSPPSSPSPTRSLSPPPFINRAPPIHQEIITHHRHIDHGFERAHVPSPPPPPRAARTKETDIDIYTSRNNTEVDIKTSSRSRTPQPATPRRDNFYDDDFVYEQERDKLRVRDTRLTVDRRRSVSARPARRENERVRIDIRDDDDEGDMYNRKVEERAYIGEAYNGATKDWSIVDVPPGTERVRMDGVGGGSQEITWQRYNGVRRSKFIPEREREREREPSEHGDPEPRRETSGMEIEISTRSRREGGNRTYEREYERIEEVDDRRVGFPRAPPKQRLGDLWTEITKDLVVREAMEESGYDFEETEYFYYILQYLGYEEVEALVALSKQIRRERRDRIRDIQREREKLERREREREEWERSERRRERDSGFQDERIIEREIIYDGPPRRAPRRSGGW